MKNYILSFTGLFAMIIFFQNCGPNGATSANIAFQSQEEVDEAAEPLKNQENLFEAGSLENSAHFSSFMFLNNSNEKPSVNLSPEAAFKGLFGLRLYKYYFHVRADELPKLIVGKSYRISFWARRVKGQGITNATPGLFIANGSELAENCQYEEYACTVDQYTAKYDMFVDSPTWKFHTLDIQAKAPYIHFDFWLHTNTENMVDIDEIAIEELD